MSSLGRGQGPSWMACQAVASTSRTRRSTGMPRGPGPLRWLCGASAGMVRVSEYSYRDLRAETNRFANLLRSLGVGKGDRVFSLLGRVPELYFTALGTLKNTSVFCPLFPAFGPEPIRERMLLGDARVLVTSARLYERKVAAIRAELPGLRHVLVAARDRPARHDRPARGARGGLPGLRHPARLIRRIWRCCTSPAAPPASRRARCTCTRRSWRITLPPASRWTCTPATCSGAPRTRAG